MACLTVWFRKSSPSRTPPFGCSRGLDVVTTSHQCCASATGFQSRDESTSNCCALSSRLCPSRLLRTWLTTCTCSRKVLDVGCVRPPTDRVLFHTPTTCSATEVLLPPGLASGTASQHTYAMKTSHTEFSGDNWKHIGFNIMIKAQCDTCIIALYKYSYWTSFLPYLLPDT